MADPETESTRDRARRERAALHEQRATETIRAIMAGADLNAETLALANRFTDETTARIAKRLGLASNR